MNDRETFIFFGGWAVIGLFAFLSAYFSLWFLVPALIFQAFWMREIFK